MLTGIRKRLSYANVIATVALFLALGGGAYAAMKAPKNSVTSRSIKNKNVKNADLANNAVTSPKIKNGTVTGADLKNGSVTGADLTDGSVGSADIGAGQVGAAALAAPEAVHKVGAPGEPAFGNGGQADCIWFSATSSSTPPPIPLTPASFYKDPYGVVHLMGNITSADGFGGDATCSGGSGAGDGDEDSTAFVLPSGYVPQAGAVFALPVGGAMVVNGVTPIDEGTVTIPAGAVEILQGVTPTLRATGQTFMDGVTFRAAGPGTGLPRKAAGAVRTDESIFDIAGIGSK